MSLTFLCLSYISQLLSGLVFVYMIVMLIVIGPGFWAHFLTEEMRSTIKDKWVNINKSVSDGDLPEEEDFIPEITSEDYTILSQVAEPDNFPDELDSQASSETQISLVTGISVFPSHDDISVDSVTTFSDIDSNSVAMQKRMPDVSDFSDDSMENDIDFQATHFNDDNSTDSESEFGGGLTFTDSEQSIQTAPAASSSPDASSSLTTAVNPLQPSVSNFISSNLIGLGALGQSYLASVINRGLSNIQQNTRDSEVKRIAKNNSSDSLVGDEDFEMISHEDIS